MKFASIRTGDLVFKPVQDEAGDIEWIVFGRDGLLRPHFVIADWQLEHITNAVIVMREADDE